MVKAINCEVFKLSECCSEYGLPCGRITFSHCLFLVVAVVVALL